MAITIDYSTFTINIPKADTTLIQSNPTEIRELDLNVFRLTLKALEESEEGMVFPDTHSHNAPVPVGGVTLARVVEIINGYTVTFEDGQYAVNLTGANSNVGDVVNVNQVSVRSANSAGLIQTREIEYASFGGGVTVDVLNGESGTLYPIGTRETPVNNFTDANLIANLRGFSKFYILGNATVDSSGVYDGFLFVGESQIRSQIIISPNASVLGCEFYDSHILGTLDGNARLKGCLITDLNYVSGYVEECVLGDGTIVLAGDAHFLNCWSGVVGTGTPTIDMGGSGSSLGMRNYNGGIQLINKSGAENVSLDINSGHVKLSSSITNGDIVIRGIGKITDDSIGATVYSDDFIRGQYLTELYESEFGKEILSFVNKVWTKYKKDGTVLKIFDLETTDDTVKPVVQRTPRP